MERLNSVQDRFGESRKETVKRLSNLTWTELGVLIDGALDTDSKRLAWRAFGYKLGLAPVEMACMVEYGLEAALTDGKSDGSSPFLKLIPKKQPKTFGEPGKQKESGEKTGQSFLRGKKFNAR